MASTPTHWKLICVPAETIDLQRLTEESNSRICIVQEFDDNGKAFEVAVDPSYLSEVQELQSQENPPYNPTHPREVEKDILGICQANRKARERWLQRAVDVIFSEHRHEIKEAYRNLTQLLGLQRELDRKILIQDISDECCTDYWHLVLPALYASGLGAAATVHDAIGNVAAGTPKSRHQVYQTVHVEHHGALASDEEGMA
ncbi:hypothetical protein KCU88_g3970, partial [Aureobasidium melanogenum]